jgi:hypothetical protein
MTALLGSRGTGQAGQPTWWASLVVRTAALPLPSEHRCRYRQEFLAELYGMTRSERLRHCTGALSRVWTVRAALTEPARLMNKEAAMAKPWRCRVGLHRWQRIRNPEGGWYRQCRECGKERVSRVGDRSRPRIDRPMSLATTRVATRRRS